MIPPVCQSDFMPRKKQLSKPPAVDNLDDAKLVIQALWDRLNDLEDRLIQNSRNSSRPPSSNGNRSRNRSPGHFSNNKVSGNYLPQSFQGKNVQSLLEQLVYWYCQNTLLFASNRHSVSCFCSSKFFVGRRHC